MLEIRKRGGKNNPNNFFYEDVLQNCIFPKEKYDKPCVALEQFGKKNNSLEFMCLSLLSSVTDAREFLKSNFPLLVLVFLTPAGKSQLLKTILF